MRFYKMNATKDKKLSDMSDNERKAYNVKMLEHRKTPEFFKETATKRINKVLAAMRTLGFMGKYNATDEQKDRLMNAIDTGVEELRASIYKQSKEKNNFNFD